MTVDTPFKLAERFIGEREIKLRGKDHPLIQWALSLCGFPTDAPDETPWCSAFVNMVAWCLRLPRSNSAAARSWLGVGVAIELRDAVVGHDVVILKRGKDPQPGPEVTDAPGHVGFYAGRGPSTGDAPTVQVLGGNQGDQVSVRAFPAAQVLGVRRLG